MTEFVLTLSCPDRPGIVAAVSGLLASRGGNITESQQFGDRDTGRFFMRVQFTVGPEYQRYPGNNEYAVPLYLTLIILGWVVALRAWNELRTEETMMPSNRRRVRR